jgi:hypothetical protein
MSEIDHLSGDDDELNPEAAAAFLGISPASLWRAVATGRIDPPSYPSPRTPRFNRGLMRRSKERNRELPRNAAEMRRRVRLGEERRKAKEEAAHT